MSTGPGTRERGGYRPPAPAHLSATPARVAFAGFPVLEVTVVRSVVSPVVLAILAAVAAGVFIATQAGFIGLLGGQVHPFVAATWVHAAGLVFGIVGVLGSNLGFQLEIIRQAPLGLLAGVLGMALVTCMAVAVGGAGLGTTLAIVTGVQLAVAMGIEAFGLFGRTVPVDPIRVGGVVLIVLGVLLVAGRAPAPGA